jgi:Chromate transport protein ChrA
MIYLKLFVAFLQVGLFSFGGGYASLPLIQNQVVDTFGWLNLDELTDIVTISQMTPGPIAINSATFVGMRVGGIGGAIIATLGSVLPSCIIVVILAILYRKYKNLKYVQGVLWGLNPAVVGMIASAGLSIILNALIGGSIFTFNLRSIDYIAAGIIVFCVVLLRKTKLDPIIIMLGAGAIGGIVYTLV